MQPRERSPSESYFWPAIVAVALHILIFGMLFVSFAMTPDLPPSRPVIQATLYQLKSQSQATTQTNQKIAGEQQKTSAPLHETEQLEQKKAEERRAAEARAAEQKKAAEVRKAQEAQKAAEAKKAEAAKKVAEQKKAEQLKRAEAAKKKAAEEAKKKAAEEARKKAAAEAVKKKAAQEQKQKAAAAEAAKKKAAEEARRKADEEKKAQALAELLSEEAGYQQALAEETGDQVAGNLDDLLVKLVSEQWRRPPSARNGMTVEILIEMLPDGTIINASVTRSSGDSPFDRSAVAAVRNVGRIAEMQELDRATFDQLYRQRRVIFKPEDLSL